MLVAASAGLPYVLSGDPSGVLSTTPSASAPADAPAADAPRVDPRGGLNVPLEGINIHHVSQVLRFDVSLPWVLSTWPRVTSGLADLELQGYRVPIVTGTRPQDVAGSLTYYFDKQQRVARLLLYGTTGDPSELVTFMAQRYGFERIVIPDPGLHLYQRRDRSRVWGEMRIKAAPIVRQDTPLARFDVSLIFDRPDR